jgi:hypothetical protein
VAILQEPRINTVEHLYSILRQFPDPIWLLGAGASRMSGVPLCDGLVARAAKWEFCHEKLRSFDDPRIKPSDFLAWLKEKPWYRSGSLADNYQAVVRHLLQPRDNRREFFLNALDTRVPASSGYQRMAEFMFRRVVRTVLTTNFDTVLPDHCRINRRPHKLQVIQTPSDYMNLRTDPRDAQYVLLHGSVEHYSDQNDSDEVQALDPNLVERLLPLLRDHPLIVIGYRGAEPSIMQHLLADHAARVEFFRMGVYWCAVDYRSAESLHPLVRNLAAVIGTNFQVVPIPGFDELMERMWALSESTEPAMARPATSEGESPSASFDMRTQDRAALSDLDLSAARTRLLTYCAAFDMPVPSRVTDQDVRELLIRFDLAIQTSPDQISPTRAGYLLFGKRPQDLIPSALVHLNTNGETRAIGGNLWNQLDSISDVLAEFNRPFRLKGEVSEPVYPYPPLALKETVVNALVHRDYASDAPVTINILSDRIEIKNPGGLVPEVLHQTGGTPLQDRIMQGYRGIKGYRNPAIADLFYSAGAMDKKGSGLADVNKWVSQNGGTLRFSPSADNTAFEIAITSRQEAVDRITGTAVPLVPSTRYAANLMEVLEAPSHVWVAPTAASGVKAIWEQSKGKWLPPFVLQASTVHTFQTFQMTSGQVAHSIPTSDFRRNANGEQIFAWLLNEHLYRHLKSCGLAIDKKRKRAYFTRTEAGERPVPYQARLRRATRVVTKPVISRTTQKVRYWEHKAFYFSFECFADTWILQILPTYVFTTDGKYELLYSERVSALATRRASRDYNSHVHNDLIFWTWVISSGEAGTYTLDAITDGAAHSSQTGDAKASTGANVKKGRRGSLEAILASTGDAPRIVISSALPISVVSSAPEPDPDVAATEAESDEFPEIEEELSRIIETVAPEAGRAR